MNGCVRNFDLCTGSPLREPVNSALVQRTSARRGSGLKHVLRRTCIKRGLGEVY